MISPFLLLLCIPLVFSHILAPFGISLGPSSFERWKVLAAFFLVILGLFEVLLFSNHLFFERLRTHFRSGLILLLLPVIFAGVFFSLQIDPLSIHPDIFRELAADFFRGSYEKYHGYIFLITLVGSLFLFSFTKNREKLFRISLWSATIVAAFALLEYADIFHIFSFSGTPSWWPGRAISTLGNPNYLAGYLLLHIPLVSKIPDLRKYGVFWMLFFGILTTKSMIGITLLLIFSVWLIIRQSFLKRMLILILVVISTTAWLLLSSLPSEKWLSFESRGVLMKETLHTVLIHPTIFLFGAGPDSLISFFALPRTPVLDQYFPATSPIDSSHDLLIDILFQYGALFLGYVLFLVWKRQKYIDNTEKSALLLFFLFFSLNPLIISAALPILLILAPDFSHLWKPSSPVKTHTP